MADKIIPPLYFLHNSVKTPSNQRLLEIDVCLAAAKAVQRESIQGCQKIGNLWRIYVKTLDVRVRLAVQGLSIFNQHAPLCTENPYESSEKDGNRPIKIMIYDVKMHFSNDTVQKHLRALGAKLTKPVTNCKIRDADGQETEFLSGDRVTYAESVHTKAHPLPEFTLIGDCVARVKHYGQKAKSETCTKCYLTDHPTWACRNGQACRVCKKIGHHEGQEACAYYTDNINMRTFGGKKDVLSNFHPCKFKYNDVDYCSREQAYQHQKATIWWNNENCTPFRIEK